MVRISSLNKFLNNLNFIKRQTDTKQNDIQEIEAKLMRENDKYDERILLIIEEN